MTYDKTFKLCRNLKDLYYKYVELRDKGHDVMSPEFLSAYKKRFEELKHEMSMANSNNNYSCNISSYRNGKE